MNSRPFLILLISFSAASAALHASDAPPVSAAPVATAVTSTDDDKKTDLEVRMDRMGKAFRKLRKQVSNPAQNASSLELLSIMDEAAKEALDFTPAKAADIPEDQRAKFVDDFRAGIKSMQDKFASLRAALAAGKNDDAAKIVTEIFEMEKKDHKAFKRPEKD